MSGVYPYCLVGPTDHPPPGLTGVGGVAVTGVAVGPFLVWLSEMDMAPVLDVDSVWTHHEVVATAVATSSPVPIRYGAWTTSLDALEERILGRRAELALSLATVDGRVEFGVRVLGPRSADSGVSKEGPMTDGRAYMRMLGLERERRRARRATQSRIAEALGSWMGTLRCDERVTFLEAPDVVAVAHLVKRGVAVHYQQRVQEFVRQMEAGYGAHVTGPWPAYSFVPS